MDPDQNPSAAARITRFESTANDARAIADLTAAYAPLARTARRGVALLDRRDVLIQDEWQLTKGGELWWFAHTPAAISLDASGKVAQLEQHGKTIFATLLQPADASFSVVEAAPLPSSPRVAGQADETRGSRPVRKLAIHLKNSSGGRLAVLISPNKQATPTLKPLDQW